MNCKNCGAECTSPSMARIWKEIRVGSVDSPDKFYLCPSCDGSVDPAEVWAEDATVTEVKA